MLENHCRFAANCQYVLARSVFQADGQAAYAQGSRIGPFQKIKAAQQCCLAGTGRSQKRRHFAVVHGQVNSFKDFLRAK